MIKPTLGWLRRVAYHRMGHDTGWWNVCSLCLRQALKEAGEARVAYTKSDGFRYRFWNCDRCGKVRWWRSSYEVYPFVPKR